MIQIVEGNDQILVPGVFQLSSGEVSLLNIFLSVLRDFDQCQEASLNSAEDVRGVVLVDEVDLHLHGSHEYEVLPKLIKMFPQVQFVLTTHSPLFILGLQSQLGESGFELYRLPDARQIGPEDFSEFGAAYRAFQGTGTHAADIETSIRAATGPQLFLEGTTDIQYIRRAAELLEGGEVLNSIQLRQAGGSGGLNRAWDALRRLVDLEALAQIAVVLYDCECNVSESDRGNAFRRVIPMVVEHPIRNGIENLFSRETLNRALEHKPAFIDIVDAHQETERGMRREVSERWTVNEDEKSNLCDWLCANGTSEDFGHFQRVLEVLQGIPGLLESTGDE